MMPGDASLSEKLNIGVVFSSLTSFRTPKAHYKPPQMPLKMSIKTIIVVPNRFDNFSEEFNVFFPRKFDIFSINLMIDKSLTISQKNYNNCSKKKALSQIRNNNMQTSPHPLKSGHIGTKDAQCAKTNEKSIFRFLRLLFFEI